jgi:hypothetical protein
MAHVVICSLVRDGIDYLPSYRRQLESLLLNKDADWHLCILEGDSRDGTWEYLVQWAAEDPRVTIGKENVGDTAEKEDRAARWARVGNACFDLIPEHLDYSHVVWLESDLCFPPDLFQRLLSHNVDVVAPIIWLGGHFYDTWGFRDLNGRRWTNNAPYHPQYRPMSLMEMGSVGSCVLFRREILDAGVRLKGTYENGLLVGMCNDARELGFKVFADTSTAILHPVDLWEAQMWRPSELIISEASGTNIAISLKEAQNLGLQMNLPLLDAAAMHNAHRKLWRNIFRRYQTNRLRVIVKAMAFPSKRYQINVYVDPPESLCRIPAVLRILHLGLRRKLVQKFFSCTVNITIDN